MAKPVVMRAPAVPRAPKPFDPNKAVLKPPRLKPASTREYGKGGTPLSGAPDFGLRGAGVGYVFDPYGR